MRELDRRREAEGGRGGLLKTPRGAPLDVRPAQHPVRRDPAFTALDDVLEAAGSCREAREAANCTPPKRRALVSASRHRVIYEINRVTVVTPGALVAIALMRTAAAA